MNISLSKTEYLRSECFKKLKNIYMAENTYHFGGGYCPTATQDSIIITEIYRTGNIKSCRIILNEKYYDIDTLEINFLTESQKKEILSYYLISASMFVTKSRRVQQYWQSTEKSNANVSLDTVSRFFRALSIMVGYTALQ